MKRVTISLVTVFVLASTASASAHSTRHHKHPDRPAVTHRDRTHARKAGVEEESEDWTKGLTAAEVADIEHEVQEQPSSTPYPEGAEAEVAAEAI